MRNAYTPARFLYDHEVLIWKQGVKPSRGAVIEMAFAWHKQLTTSTLPVAVTVRDLATATAAPLVSTAATTTKTIALDQNAPSCSDPDC